MPFDLHLRGVRCRRASIVLTLVLVLSGMLVAQGPIRRAEGVWRGTAIELAAIEGVEYEPQNERFFLYATQADPSPSRNRPSPDGASLFADDVSRMALALTKYGGFAFSLERREDYMEVDYLHTEGDALARIFRGSRVEATFLETDRILKALVQGDRVADDLRTGASGFALCSAQLCASGQQMLSDLSTVYVTYFNLDVTYKWEHGLRLWFARPTLQVMTATRKSDSQPPECLRTFARALTANMDQLVKHQRLGAAFRRLSILLQLAHAMGRAKGMYVPVDVRRLESLVPRRSEKPQRVRLRGYRLVCQLPGELEKVRDFRIPGGIKVFTDTGGSDPVTHLPRSRPRSNSDVMYFLQAANTERTRPRQEFIIESTSVAGKRMLRIDVSECIGLKGGPQ